MPMTSSSTGINITGLGCKRKGILFNGIILGRNIPVKNKGLIIVALMGVTSVAFAGTVDQQKAFYHFCEAVESRMASCGGIALAVAIQLMGGYLGITKGSPTPAFLGWVGAVFLHWGPAALKNLAANGGLF